MKTILFLLMLACTACTAQIGPVQVPVENNPEFASNVVAGPYTVVVATLDVTAIFNPSANILTAYECQPGSDQVEFIYYGPADVFMLDTNTITAQTPSGSINASLTEGSIEVLICGRNQTSKRPQIELTTVGN